MMFSGLSKKFRWISKRPSFSSLTTIGIFSLPRYPEVFLEQIVADRGSTTRAWWFLTCPWEEAQTILLNQQQNWALN